MTNTIINAVKKMAQLGHWYSNDNALTEAQQNEVEQVASTTSLDDATIIAATSETGATDLKTIAEAAMSQQVGSAVKLNIQNR